MFQPKMNIVSFKSIFLFILLHLSSIRGQEDNEELLAEIELTNLELQDDCENIANTYRSCLLSNTFKDKVIKI